MPLQSLGPISFNDIQNEFGGTNPISLDEYYGAADGIPASGEISIFSFYGKANTFAFTVAANTTNADLYTLAVNAGWDEVRPLQCTIDSNVYVYSTSTSTPALSISGTFPNGVTVINDGKIIGMGGAGGNTGPAGGGAGQVGGAGGTAIDVSSTVTIVNNSIIAGGGGGGSGAASYWSLETGTYYGGGGGGGQSGLSNSAGGTGFENGSAGTVSSGGAGGAGRAPYAGSGGTGGSWGQASGGAGGACLTGDSYVTWSATGTRYGSIL
jgi:hypothetical protein